MPKWLKCPECKGKGEREVYIGPILAIGGALRTDPNYRRKISHAIRPCPDCNGRGGSYVDRQHVRLNS